MVGVFQGDEVIIERAFPPKGAQPPWGEIALCVWGTVCIWGHMSWAMVRDGKGEIEGLGHLCLEPEFGL